MLNLEYKNGTLHLTVMGSSEEVYDSLEGYFFSECDFDHYSVSGVCFEEYRETVFGLINSNQPFVIEGNRNDVSLQKTLVRAWNKPRGPFGTVQDSRYPDSERTRGTDQSPCHRTG